METPYTNLPRKADLYKYFCKIPKSRCVFVTIRDPKDRYTLNKAKDWIKKSVDAMTIVSSPQGGRHYHMLCALTPKVLWSPRCSRGIHFDIQYLNKQKRSEFSIPSPEEIQDSLMWQHVFETQRQNIMNRLDRRYPGCDIHFKIAVMVHDYHRIRADRAKRLEAKTSHERHVLATLNYLEKNLNENSIPDGIPEQYTHYYNLLP